MKKIGIFYGSTTGTTEEVANKIAGKLGVDAADVYNVAETAPDKVGDYDVLLLGSSTWGDGELQDDWYDFIDGLQALDLKGKEIAVFGCGDESMTDTFCNAVGIIYDRLQETGAKFIGDFNADGYSYDASKADVGGRIVGLIIDETNHPELTDKRIADWCAEVQAQM
ncbi:MAG: flavodoxin [Paramuribaculum sp.]|nr:flavodoxin [Paramuribaculum sp.]